MASKRLRQVGLAVGLAWACWWVFFETAEAIGTREFGQAVIFGVLMLGGIALAWKWPAAGAGLLLAEGVAAIVTFAPMWWRRFHFAGTLLMFAWMPLPPLAAGILLLLSRRHRAMPPARQ